MQAGGTAKEYGRIDLSLAVRDVVGQFTPFCEKNGFTIQAEITDDLTVKGDEAQLKRVVYNFIDNAINHTDESKRIYVSFYQIGDHTRFEVTDYGKGIADNDVPNIWDRYFTAHSRKNKAVVSGLGLSIAREILIAHGARFGVDNKKHCTFWFEL